MIEKSQKKRVQKKIFCLVLLAMASFVLAGCGAGGPQDISYNFKQGIKEVTFSFLENAPPKQVYPSSNFKMIAAVDNQAAYDVTNGVVKIVGLDARYFYVTPEEQEFGPLLGKSILSPAGDKVFLEFDGFSQALFENAEEYVGNFLLKAAYRSTMYFADTVCINPTLYDVYSAGCKVQASKAYSGQGAPVAVTKLEEVVSPDAAVEFRIFLRNSGRGKVSTLTLNNARLGGKELECEFQRAVENKKSLILNQKMQEAALICKTLLDSQNSYETTLSLGFSYKYEVEQRHSLRLVK